MRSCEMLPERYSKGIVAGPETYGAVSGLGFGVWVVGVGEFWFLVRGFWVLGFGIWDSGVEGLGVGGHG